MVVSELLSRFTGPETGLQSIESHCFECISSAKITLLESDRAPTTNCCHVGLCNNFVVVCSPRRVNASDFRIDLVLDVSSLAAFISALDEVLAGKWVEAPNSSTTITSSDDRFTIGTYSRDLDIALFIENNRRFLIDGNTLTNFKICTSLESGKQILDAFKRTRESLHTHTPS